MIFSVSVQRPNGDAYDKELKRGALYNLLGVVARLVQPLYILVITWLWGPAFSGVYLLGYSLAEVVSGVIVAGYTDATTIFGSRHADAADTDEGHRRALYRVLGSAFIVSAGLAILAGACAQLAGRELVERLFPRYRELLPGLYFLAWALVPRSVSQIAIAATKATMRMEYDALVNGVVQPLGMLTACFVTYGLQGRLTMLFGAQLVVDCVVCGMALQVFAKRFSLKDLRRAFAAFHIDREALGFAVPQSLNLTFNRYIARLDGIMLASFGLPEADLGYFTTAALLTSNIAQIRLVFSGAMAPVVARYHANGEKGAFEGALGRVSRWTTSMVVPAVLVAVVLREDVLHLVSSTYGKNSLFVAVLLIPPLTNCAYGMAGACLMFTGHSRVTLANSFSIALLNTLFTYLLIPRYGMLGAAVATALATSMIMLLQMIELRKIENVGIGWSAVWKPHVGLLLGLIVVGLLWDPASLPPLGRAVTALGMLLGYAMLMVALDLEELRGVRRAIGLFGGRSRPGAS